MATVDSGWNVRGFGMHNNVLRISDIVRITGQAV
jgi:hypothetical protein